jgi:hypothetical protein
LLGLLAQHSDKNRKKSKMAHYAKVVNGIVESVVVAEENFFQTFPEKFDGEWIQTSYNTRGGIHYQPDSDLPSEDQSKALRKNYAGIGYKHDRVKDAFIPPKPFESWTLNDETCLWEPPTPSPASPTDDKLWYWDEETLSWKTYDI